MRMPIPRLRAVAQALARLDPQTSQALAGQADWQESAETALREAGILLATPALQDSRAAAALRDRIDQLLDVVPRAPQVAGE